MHTGILVKVDVFDDSILFEFDDGSNFLILRQDIRSEDRHWRIGVKCTLMSYGDGYWNKIIPWQPEVEGG